MMRSLSLLVLVAVALANKPAPASKPATVPVPTKSLLQASKYWDTCVVLQAAPNRDGYKINSATATTKPKFAAVFRDIKCGDEKCKEVRACVWFGGASTNGDCSELVECKWRELAKNEPPCLRLSPIDCRGTPLSYDGNRDRKADLKQDDAISTTIRNGILTVSNSNTRAQRGNRFELYDAYPLNLNGVTTFTAPLINGSMGTYALPFGAFAFEVDGIRLSKKANFLFYQFYVNNQGNENFCAKPLRLVALNSTVSLPPYRPFDLFPSADLSQASFIELTRNGDRPSEYVFPFPDNRCFFGLYIADNGALDQNPNIGSVSASFALAYPL